MREQAATEKTCSKCRALKPVEEFSRASNKRDGLHPHCKACASIYAAKWYAENKEKNKEACAAWYEKNSDKAKAAAAARYIANPEKIKTSISKWRKGNPEKVRAWNAKWNAANLEAKRIYEQNRRARKRDVGGKLSKGLADKLFKLQRGKCACCGKPLGDDYHLDHRMPLALGGANEDWNMQLLRQQCNNQKHARHPVDFMQSRGFLL